MSGHIPEKDSKTLFLRSGNRCTKCKRVLVINRTETDPESIIAIKAHIKGEKPQAPRYDPAMSDTKRNCYANLICVCGDCHKEIDDQPNTFSVEVLHKMKEEHEEWIYRSTLDEVPRITFVELSIVTKFLVAGNYNKEDSFSVTAPKNKIERNKLSPTSESLILMGMTQVQQVGHFINRCPDIEFGERLKQGFVLEYLRLIEEDELSGDELFDALLSFASGGSNDFKQKAAGLSVLTYMFEKCEVFEG